MPEQSDRHSALAAQYQTGDFGARGNAPGVMFAECRALAVFQLNAAEADPALTKALRKALDLTLPLTPNTATGSANVDALWLGPGRWQITSAVETPAALEARLQAVLRGTSGYLVDISQARTVIRMRGPRVRDVLAKGCPVDLDIYSFQPGHCCSSTLGGIVALVHHQDDAITWEVSALRSFGRSLWEWLTDAAAEYGYRVEEPVGSR